MAADWEEFIAARKNPGTVVAPGFCSNISAWRTAERDEPL